MSELVAMGGHGVYVWSAYGVSLLALLIVGLAPVLAMRRTVRRLRQRLDAEEE